jgi:hypothetical protein
MRCGKTNCRFRAESPVLRGPYWHWTRCVVSKTQSRALSQEQAQRYQPTSRPKTQPRNCRDVTGEARCAERELNVRDRHE